MTDGPIFFWKHPYFGGFSNFHPSIVVIDNKSWPTVEHYYQAMKSLDETEQERVRQALTPGQSKKIGQTLTLRPDWEEVKYEVMLKALRVKFERDPLRALLISTGGREIYEDSPYDKIWGTGVLGGIGTGQNLLGKALMQVRGEMAQGA
jgi:N-glycosidase YbiA